MNIGDTVLHWETEENTPWILWRQQEGAVALSSQILPEDSVSTSSSSGADVPMTDYSTQPIRRAQYHSIVKRIDQAKKQSGQYSSWKP